MSPWGTAWPRTANGRVAAAKRASAHQALARKQRGSSNRRKARAMLAARHRKIANQRCNFHYQVARALVAR